jgi:PST family polysaccharide transporter
MTADPSVPHIEHAVAVPLTGTPVVADSHRRSPTLLAGSVFGTVMTLGGIQMLAILLTMARSKATAITLGPAGVGAVSLIDQLVSLLGQIVTFSLPFAAVKFLSAEHSVDSVRFSRLYAAFTWMLIILAVAGAAVGILLLRWWPSLLGHELSEFGAAAKLSFLSIPGITLIGFLTNVIASARRTRMSGLYGLANAAALSLLSIVGVLVAGLNGYYVGSLVAVTLVALGGMVYLARSEGVRIGAPQTGLRELREHQGVLGFAGSLYITSFALPAATLAARYAILKAGGLEAAGLLQAAMALGLAAALVLRQSNILLLTPTMNRQESDDYKLGQAADYLRSFSLVVGVVTLPLILFPHFWLYALYSSRFLAAAPYAYIFVLAEVIQLFAGVPLGLLIGVNHIAAQLTVTLTGLTALATLSWLLAPVMGIAGVGAAFLVQHLLVLVLSTWCVRRALATHVGKAVQWLPLCVIVVLALVGAGSARYAETSLGVFVAKIAVGATLTVAALIAAHRQGMLQGWPYSTVANGR